MNWIKDKVKSREEADARLHYADWLLDLQFKSAYSKLVRGFGKRVENPFCFEQVIGYSKFYIE